MTWLCGKYRFCIGRVAPALLMGIVNVTPDSFSEGAAATPEHTQAIERGYRLFDEGAAIIDVGGESTRPGAEPVTADEELWRIVPVIEALVARDIPVSADTMKPAVMRAALSAGACIINDVAGFRDAASVETIAGSDCGVIIMHMRGEPKTMQQEVSYDSDVLAEVSAFLTQQSDRLAAVGVDRARICWDVGFGFGKTFQHNRRLFRSLEALTDMPMIIGVSRKSMLGHITGAPAEERMSESIVAAVLAWQRGVRLFRVHDVAETKRALAVARELDKE